MHSSAEMTHTIGQKKTGGYGMDEKKERQQQKYNDYVKQVTPTHNLWWNMVKAFVTGGIICIIAFSKWNRA